MARVHGNILRIYFLSIRTPAKSHLLSLIRVPCIMIKDYHREFRSHLVYQLIDIHKLIVSLHNLMIKTYYQSTFSELADAVRGSYRTRISLGKLNLFFQDPLPNNYSNWCISLVTDVVISRMTRALLGKFPN